MSQNVLRSITNIKILSIVLTFVLFFIICNLSYSQKQDSIQLYKKIKKIAYKHKFTKWAYETTFVDPEPIEYPIKPTSNSKKNVNPYLKYSGCLIRSVHIIVYDPFGHSVMDTVPRKINSLQKLGNHSHTATQHWVIRNLLLFKKDDRLNALYLSESERLLRQSAYISDARIFISKTKSVDSVDVNVVVQDKWPITIPILLTDVSGNLRYRNQNLLGLGQQFEQYIGYKRPDLFDYNGFYNIANLANTYISSRLFYQTDKNGTSTGISFDRPFFSPLTKWAGGVAISHSWHFYNYTNINDGTTERLPLNNLSYDVWTGKSIKISDDTSFFGQSTNIILAGRFYNNTFQKRPSFSVDTLKSNYNTSAYIGNVGFSVQQYYKDKFIYRFGANEDVPEGVIVQFLYGGIKKEFTQLRYYTGIEIARAKHFNFGYLSSTFSYGVFFNKKNTNDITTKFNLYYFSDLLQNKKWYIREFLNYNLVHGENKISHETIALTSNELYGLNTGSLVGNTKMVLNLETVAYAPYNLIGFNFAPVLLMGFGMIGDTQNKLFKSNIYQAYSLGIMVRNENLLNSTFQISVGAYPNSSDGKNYFKYNPVTSFTLRVRGFSVSRPVFIGY